MGLPRDWGGLGGYDVPSLLGLFGGSRELKLDAVNTVYAVNEENENEDECNLHPILYLGDNWILGDEAIPTKSALTSV